MHKKLAGALIGSLLLGAPALALAQGTSLDGLGGSISTCLTPPAGTSQDQIQSACNSLLMTLIAIVTQLIQHPTQPPQPQDNFYVSPASGAAPLHVDFYTKQHFGTEYLDTGSFLASCPKADYQSGKCDMTIGPSGWTYTQPGTYHPSFVNDAGQTIGTATVTVTSNSTSGITVTAPNGGEQWEEGVLNSITWSPYGYNPDINPSRDVVAYLERRSCDHGGPCTYETIGGVVPSGKASIHWVTGFADPSMYATYADKGTGPYGLVPPGQYYVRVVNTKTGASDRSDAPFTVLPKRVDLKVNGSDGPVTVVSNQPVALSWSAGAGVTNCVLGGNVTPNGPVSNSGSGTYYPMFNGVSQIQISLECRPSPISDNDPYPTEGTNGNGVFVTDSVTLLASGVTQATAKLRITAPNGGEQIDPSKQMDIYFDSAGISSYSVGLYKNDQWKYWITKNNLVPSYVQGGKVSWTPSSELQGLGAGDNAGAIWKIYVTAQRADAQGYVDDKSDAPFSFSSRSTASGLTVSATQQPSNSLAPQGAIVPFTTFTLTNNTASDISFTGMYVSRGGSATGDVLSSLALVDSGGTTVGSSNPVNWFGNETSIGNNFTVQIIRPGQSKTYTVQGYMARSLTGHAGEILSLAVTRITAAPSLGSGTAAVSGSLPISGATQTINTTLNACYPPQTSLYGYTCWDTAQPTTTTVVTNGNVSLVEIGTSYYIAQKGSPSIGLTNGGSPVGVGTVSGWTPIAIAAVASGFDIAWKHTNGQYTVWAISSQGAYTSSLMPAVNSNDPQLLNIEPTFNQDLNQDGTIGAPVQQHVTLSADKSAYAPGETITITWNTNTPNANDWIGITLPGQAWSIGRLTWQGTYGVAQGLMRRAAPTTPGTYDIAYYSYADRAGTGVGLTRITITVASTTASANDPAAQLAAAAAVIANILNGGRVSGSGSVTSAAIPASATSHVFNQDLWRGQEGADVAALQRILAKLGFYQGDITGTFYDQTREAVIRFQIAHGIKATGYVAALTRAALNEAQ